MVEIASGIIAAGRGNIKIVQGMQLASAPQSDKT
jgi:hypothetical protein